MFNLKVIVVVRSIYMQFFPDYYYYILTDWDYLMGGLTPPPLPTPLDHTQIYKFDAFEQIPLIFSPICNKLSIISNVILK